MNVTSAEHEFMYSITVIIAMGSHIWKLLKWIQSSHPKFQFPYISSDCNFKITFICSNTTQHNMIKYTTFLDESVCISTTIRDMKGCLLSYIRINSNHITNFFTTLVIIEFNFRHCKIISGNGWSCLICIRASLLVLGRRNLKLSLLVVSPSSL